MARSCHNAASCRKAKEESCVKIMIRMIRMKIPFELCQFTGIRCIILSTKSFRFASRMSKSTSLSSLRPDVRAYPSSKTLSLRVELGAPSSFLCVSETNQHFMKEDSKASARFSNYQKKEEIERYLSWCHSQCLVSLSQASPSPRQTAGLCEADTIWCNKAKKSD
jgi:hypothetical protein